MAPPSKTHNRTKHQTQEIRHRPRRGPGLEVVSTEAYYIDSLQDGTLGKGQAIVKGESAKKIRPWYRTSWGIACITGCLAGLEFQVYPTGLALMIIVVPGLILQPVLQSAQFDHLSFRLLAFVLIFVTNFIVAVVLLWLSRVAREEEQPKTALVLRLILLIYWVLLFVGPPLEGVLM